MFLLCYNKGNVKCTCVCESVAAANLCIMRNDFNVPVCIIIRLNPVIIIAVIIMSII